MKPEPLLSIAEIERVMDVVDPEFTRQNNRLSPNAGLVEHRFGSVVAFRDAGKPRSDYYNRVLGLTEQSLDTLSDVASFYAEAKLDHTLSLPPHRHISRVRAALESAGYRQVGADSVLFLRVSGERAHELVDSVSVRLVEGADLATLFDLMGQAGQRLATQEEFLSAYRSSSMQFFIASVGDVPAGWASMYACGDIAWLNNAYTLEPMRHRGCHRALLRARIAASAKAGCALVITDTLPGSASHRNTLAAGFQLGYTTVEYKKTLR